MMNPTYHFARMRELLDEFEPSRERSLAATKLEECELWLARCKPTAEAAGRDLAAPAPVQCPACGFAQPPGADGRVAGHLTPSGSECPGSGWSLRGAAV